MYLCCVFFVSHITKYCPTSHIQQNSPTPTTGCPDFCKALAHAESTHTHKKSLKASNCLKRLKTRQKRKICAVCQVLAKQPDFHGEQRPPGGRGELLDVRPAGTPLHRARGAPGGDPSMGVGPGTGSCCHLLAADPSPRPLGPRRALAALEELLGFWEGAPWPQGEGCGLSKGGHWGCCGSLKVV